MGAPMAMRLLNAGHPLCVYDRNADAAAPFVARGSVACHSPADVASRADAVFMCLPTPDIMRSVATGENGIVRGSTVRMAIDLGTSGPAMERTVAAAIADHGVIMIDSPVTGGIAGAQAGTLAVMVACPRSAYDEIAPILANLGRVIFTGEVPGLAQTAKLANNLLSAAALAVSSEAMAMGVKAGIDPQVLLNIINAGSGRNSATEDKFPRAILPGTFDFGMDTGLFLKDIRLCLDEAESLGVPMIAGGAVKQLFAATRAEFGDESDFTSIAKLIEGWARVKIRASGD
jgi:3-hydroxyisobutyrate dehydrogenase-like beta-hydroxyacid dehydrogenase